MTQQVAHPVQTVREHATNFEAALAVCLAEPKVRAVHKLRTESRRLEAQIALLGALKGLPPHRKQADKVLRVLAKFRRAAGHVRDLDVQNKTLESQCKRLGKRGRSQMESAAASANDPSSEGTPQPHQLAADDLRRMIATREHRRKELATELVSLIEKRQAKMTGALENLLSALGPSANVRLSAAKLVRIADDRFSKTSARAMKKLSTDSLHSIRKAAKQARYLAETSGSQAAVTAAKRYEQLQEAGGKWHDWLDLASAAAKELGKKHTTAAEFAEFRDDRLTQYRALLEQFR